MLGALSQQHGQYSVGRYLGVRPSYNESNAPLFAYERITQKERRYNQIVQNLITQQESIIIKTNYAYDWRGQALVQLQDGKIYTITNLQAIEEDINGQALSAVIKSSDTLYYLELVGEAEGL